MVTAKLVLTDYCPTQRFPTQYPGGISALESTSRVAKVSIKTGYHMRSNPVGNHCSMYLYLYDT